MRHSLVCWLMISAAVASGAERRISLAEYRDKVQAAWMGQVIGASFGFAFEGKARNVSELDHYLTNYTAAVVDDDYYYEMVALYGFERFGLGMTVEQLGEMWKEYKAGTWGSSEQARLALERGIKAPDSGSPRYNRLFHTIGPQFSSDIYGMISPGMVNVAGAVARNYSHVNGYAEGSDGAVFVAGCISEAFFETDPYKIVKQAAQLIDPRSNYRKAVDQVLAGWDRHESAQQIAAESEARWRPDYPMMNNSVANGALVAIGILFGDGNYLKSINLVTSLGDFTDADCNAANVASVVGAMRGWKTIPASLAEPLHDRIYGDHMGPLNLGRTIDEKISDLASRVAAVGEKNILAHGGRIEGGTLVIPRETVRTQPLEYFDINDYGSLWNSEWKLEGAGRENTYLDGAVLVTFPRDSRPCMLTAMVDVPAGSPRLKLNAGYAADHPWRLQVLVDDDSLANKMLGEEKSGEGRKFVDLSFDLTKYAGQRVRIRLIQWSVPNRLAASAYWRSIQMK